MSLPRNFTVGVMRPSREPPNPWSWWDYAAGRPVKPAAVSRASRWSSWLSWDQDSATKRLADGLRHPTRKEGAGRAHGLPFLRRELAPQLS